MPSSKQKKKELDIEDWIVVFFLLAIGVYLIRAGILAGWDILTIGLGIAFSGGAILGTPPLRIFVKVAINRVSGKQVFHVEQSNISDSNVIGVAREVHIHEAPRTVVREAPPSVERQREQQEWEVDEEFTLSGDDYRVFPVDLNDGEEIVGRVEADGDVSCYVFGRASLKSFEEGERFNPYWETEDVTKTKISFVAPGKRTYYFVVEHTDEDEDVSVSVKLQS